jgi:ribosomal-protein-alanine N-acetyltransferase
MRPLETSRLVLEPLVLAHAEVMCELLADPLIYLHLDEPSAPALAHLRRSYAQREARESPDGKQLWLNWIVRPRGGPPVGYVQATVLSPGIAWIAYVLASKFWGRGYAVEAVQAMLTELTAAYEVRRYLATVEAANHASIRLLERLGFRRSAGERFEGESLSPTEHLFIGEPAPGADRLVPRQ